MKNILLVLIFVLTTSMASLAGDAVSHTEASISPTQRVEILERRLEEIKSVSSKELPKEIRKAYRKEVKEIKKELKTHASDGIYISAGGLIIIILLLILLA